MDEALRNAWNDLKADPTDLMLVERYAALLRRSGESAGIAQQADAVMRLARKAKVEPVNLMASLRDMSGRHFISETIDGAKSRRGGRLQKDVDRAETDAARIGIELLIERGMHPAEIAQDLGAAPRTMSVEQIVATLEDRELFFDHWENGSRNVILIPSGWDIQLADDENPDFPDEPVNEAYGYMATRFVSNDDEIETQWVNLDDLARCSVVSEAEARKIHPALFEHLEKVSRGEDG